MENFSVTSFAGFHELVEKTLPKGGIYRGLKNESYSLVSSLGRLLDTDKGHVLNKETILRDERDSLELFQTECVQYVDVLPEGKLELMALAQHHGLHTRLMDWTLNPLVALFFATEKYFDGQQCSLSFWLQDPIYSQPTNKGN